MQVIEKPRRTRILLDKHPGSLIFSFPPTQTYSATIFLFIFGVIFLAVFAYGLCTYLPLLIADLGTIREYLAVLPYFFIGFVGGIFLERLTVKASIKLGDFYFVLRKKSLLFTTNKAVFMGDIKSITAETQRLKGTVQQHYLALTWRRRDKQGQRTDMRSVLKIGLGFLEHVNKPECDWMASEMNQFLTANQQMKGAPWRPIAPAELKGW